MISHRARLDVPVALVVLVSGLLAAGRREIGTRKNTRSLGCYRQALREVWSGLWPRAPATSSWTAPWSATTAAVRKPPAAGISRKSMPSMRKAKGFGGKTRRLFYPDGRPMLVSDVLPGRVNERPRPRNSSSRCCGRSLAGCRAWPTAVINPQATASAPVKKPRGGPELDISAQAATYCSARRARLTHRSARPRRRRSTEQV